MLQWKFNSVWITHFWALQNLPGPQFAPSNTSPISGSSVPWCASYPKHCSSLTSITFMWWKVVCSPPPGTNLTPSQWICPQKISSSWHARGLLPPRTSLTPQFPSGQDFFPEVKGVLILFPKTVLLSSHPPAVPAPYLCPPVSAGAALTPHLPVFPLYRGK